MTDESSELTHAVDAQRSSTAPEWEVFVREGERSETSNGASGETASREGETDPLTHVGSVRAPTREVAVEQAERLFGDAATTLWLCPATEVVRRTTEDAALANR